jgi:transcriptional regulator with XRE-family HTH domain
MDIRLRFGDNVSRLRRQKGWSQEQLAFECKMHRTYISGIERGIRNPTIIVAERIARALGIKAGVLME